MTQKIIVERLGQSAIVTINNPPANVWTIESLQELARAMDALAADAVEAGRWVPVAVRHADGLLTVRELRLPASASGRVRDRIRRTRISSDVCARRTCSW